MKVLGRVVPPLFVALVVAAALWPLPLHPNHQVTDFGDPFLNAWILEWESIALREGLPLWDAPIFHPAKGALAFSENLLGILPVYMGLRGLGASPIGAHNLLLVLGLALGAAATYALARELRLPVVPAMVAGILVSVAPPQMEQLPHLQICWTPWMPLAFLFTLRALRGRSWELWLAGGALAAHLASSLYMGTFTLLAWGVAVAIVLIVYPERRRALAPHLAGALVVVGLTGAALSPPYEWARETYGMTRHRNEMRAFALTPLRLVTASGIVPHYRFLERPGTPEPHAFPGLVILGLAAVALWPRRRPAPAADADATAPPPHRHDWPPALLFALDVVALAGAAYIVGRGGSTIIAHLRWPSEKLGNAALIALAAFVLRTALAWPRVLIPPTRRLAAPGCWRCLVRSSPLGAPLAILAVAGAFSLWLALGPDGLLYEGLAHLLSPLRSIRAVGRAILVALLPLALLAGAGVQRLLALMPSRSGRAGLGVAAICAAWFDGCAVPHELSGLDGRLPPAYARLASERDGTVLAELPMEGEWHNVFGDAYPQYWQSWHRHPLANGYSGFVPPASVALIVTVREHFPETVAVDALLAAGVRWVLVHPEAFPAPEWKRFVRRSRLRSDGRVEYVGEFPHGRAKDLLFRLRPAPAAVESGAEDMQ